MKTFSCIAALLFAGVCCVAAQSSAENTTMTTELTDDNLFTLFKFNQKQPDLSTPKSAADLVNHYVVKPLYFAVGEFVSKFPYETADKIKNHRFFRVENLRNLNVTEGTIKNALAVVFNLPVEDLALIDQFLGEYLAGLITHFERHFAVFMFVMREFLSASYPSLEWMNPKGTLTFEQ